VLAAVFYVLRTGVQWKALPAGFGSASAVHRYFQLWTRKWVLRRIRQEGLGDYEEMKGIDWEYQSIDGSMGKAPLAREAAVPNPADRGKQGSKRHILVDGAGVPLPVMLTGANVNDVTRMAAVLDGIMIERPEWEGVPRGAEKAELKRDPGKRARRRVVERTFAWLNRFRKLPVRYEKKAGNYPGLLMFACAIIAFRQTGVV